MPVVLEGGLVEQRRNAVTGKEEETFVPSILAEKGIRFAISNESSGQRSLWYQAALAIGEGLDRATALNSVTTTAAEILGLEAKIATRRAAMEDPDNYSNHERMLELQVQIDEVEAVLAKAYERWENW